MRREVRDPAPTDDLLVTDGDDIRRSFPIVIARVFNLASWTGNRVHESLGILANFAQHAG